MVSELRRLRFICSFLLLTYACVINSALVGLKKKTLDDSWPSRSFKQVDVKKFSQNHVDSRPFGDGGN